MLSEEEVKNIAHLARIGLADQEIGKYRHDLSVVLDWMQELREVDTGGVEPIGHITGLENATAKDTISVATPAEKKRIVANFPQTKDGYNKVRAVFSV